MSQIGKMLKFEPFFLNIKWHLPYAEFTPGPSIFVSPVNSGVVFFFGAIICSVSVRVISGGRRAYGGVHLTGSSEIPRCSSGDLFI